MCACGLHPPPRSHGTQRCRSSCTTSSAILQRARRSRVSTFGVPTSSPSSRGSQHHGYRAVTLFDVWEHWHGRGALPRKPIVLTFDDGDSSVARFALPELRRLGWPGVLNLKVGNLPDGIRPKEVRALVEAGWELGAHTITHPDLTTLSDQALTREVEGSKREIEQRFGVKVRFFCYPSGRFDPRVVAAVRAAGFLGATTTAGRVGRPTEPFTLGRFRVGRYDGSTVPAP